MKENVLRKLIREEITKVLKEYTTPSTDQYEPYYQITDIKKSELHKSLQYHGDMKVLRGKCIDAYWSEEEKTVYVCAPNSHNLHAFTCDNENELKAIVMKYDKVRADQAEDIYDMSKTHVLPKEN